MTSRREPLGVALGILAAFTTYLGGPTFFVVGFPLAVAALLLGAQILAVRRSAAGWAACGLGVLTFLIPVVQFAFQS